MTASGPSQKNMLTIALPGRRTLVMTLGSLWKDTYMESVMSLLEGKALPGESRVSTSVNARALKITIDRSPVFVKFFGFRGTKDRWVLRKSRGFRAMKNALMLSSKGFNTPALIAQGDVRKGLRLLNTFTLEQWVDGLNSYEYIYAAFMQYPATRTLMEKRALIKTVGQTIGRLHQKGIFHGDLRPGNLLIIKKEDSIELFFVDNERTNFFEKGIPERLRLKNLVQMNMLRMPQITYSDRLRFFRAYLSENPDLASHERKWIRAVCIKTRKRQRTNKACQPNQRNHD